MDKQRQSVVVVGGGVGGLRAASILSRNSQYDVTLISKKRTFDHNTSLYRNRWGRSLRHISFNLDVVFGRRTRDIDLVRAEIESFDPENKQVISTSGIDYSYDSLLIALEGEGRIPHGVDHNFAHNAYSASDMNALRRSIIADVESSQPSGNYVVIGAGETGVEIVYELKTLLDSLAKKHQRDTQQYNVVLIEESDRILPKSDNRAGERAKKRLEKKGVHIYLNRSVVKSAKSKLFLSEDKVMQSSLVVCAAGRRANRFFIDNREAFLLSQSAFVRVSEIQEAEGYNNVYILGNSKDISHDLGVRGKLYDAKYVADLLESKRLGREIPPYEPPPYTAAIQLGKTWGIHETADHVVSGRLGWIRKRWSDRNHFSTLLPIRLWFVAWLWGTRHDEIY